MFSEPRRERRVDFHQGNFAVGPAGFDKLKLPDIHPIRCSCFLTPSSRTGRAQRSSNTVKREGATAFAASMRAVPIFRERSRRHLVCGPCSGPLRRRLPPLSGNHTADPAGSLPVPERGIPQVEEHAVSKTTREDRDRFENTSPNVLGNGCNLTKQSGYDKPRGPLFRVVSTPRSRNPLI